jgi:hypothetical protein
MTHCDDFRAAIDALVDGTLSGEERSALDRHLAACPSCASLAEDLLVIRRAARSLPAIDPPEPAWRRLAASVAAPAPVAAPARTWRQRVAVPLAIAAVLLAAVAITLVVRRDRAVMTPAAPATGVTAERTAPSADLGSIEDELRQAESHYENAIDKLETLARDRRALDPGVAADLQTNMLIIDRAIGESRAALRAQPTSERAQESLFEAFRSKITLLQDTIALINEMRKGNQAETARIAEGLSKP